MREQSTPHFAISGSNVIGSGSTNQGAVDYFYGQNNVGYTVTITAGASLFNTGANPGGEPPLLDSNGGPYHEVIYLSYGTVVNNGTLNTYPQPLANPATNYHKSPAIIFINNTAAHPSQVINNGMIGDFPGVSNKSNPFYSYDQENDVGVFLYDGTITNNAGAVISGFNAVFTKGNGTLNNYGTLLGSNDGALTGYVVNNYANASLSNGVAGFACIHAYNTVNNYGYMLGQDYGILADGHGFTINDYGGQAVAGVSNFDGSQVYNGEISALQRGPETPNVNGPYMTLDAIMLDTNGTTVNLYSTTINNVVYLPVIVGPMEGGFNGDFASGSAHVVNTLNFVFNGITVAQQNALQAAVAHSYHSGPHGVYSSGSVVLNGNTYHWEDFAFVTVQGKAITGTPVPTSPTPSTTKTTAVVSRTSHPHDELVVPAYTNNATTGQAALTNHDTQSVLSIPNIGLMITGLLLLLLLAFATMHWQRKRSRHVQNLKKSVG